MRKNSWIGSLGGSMAVTAASGFASCGNDEETPATTDPVAGTAGLKYTLSSDKKFYTVSDMGNCTETEIVIGNVHNGLPVKVIKDYAFADCVGLKSVMISEGIELIGGHAFGCCSGLAGLTIPNSVTRILEQAFVGCGGLTGVTIGDGVLSIGRDAFGGCVKLERVLVGKSVTSIGDRAFRDCSGLAEVTLQNGLKIIGSQAFLGCCKLAKITIPSSVMSIGESAFDAYKPITNITYRGTKEEWRSIQKGIFYRDVTVQCTDGKLDKEGNEIVG